MLTVSKKLSKMKASATLEIAAQAKAMSDRGENVVSFSAGEPDFDTPQPIKDAAKKAIDNGFTKYTPASGTLELKQAICEKFLKDNSLRYEPKQVVVSCGAKHSLNNIFQSICNPKDEVIIISPYWLSYPEMVYLADAKPVIIKTDEKDGFMPSIKAIKKAVTKKTKAIVINSPSNPAGIVLNAPDLQNIADIAVSKKFFVISDEIYEKLIYDHARHISIASLGDKIHSLTITVNGVSKSYSMTGWRIGYMAAQDQRVVNNVANMQSHSTSNPTSISQKAALAALKMDDTEIRKMCAEYQNRRDMMIRMLDDIKKLSYVKPRGAFYLYVNIKKTGMTSSDFAKKFLLEKKVAVVPCESFGSKDHVRLSFATSSMKIIEGMERLKTWVEQ